MKAEAAVRQIVSDRKGFTLIELIVAMMVMTIGLMAMLDGIGNYMKLNLDNSMRSEAMRIAEATIETLRNSRFSDLQNQTVSDVPATGTVSRAFRNVTVNYTVQWSRQNISSSSVAIRVNVTWSYRNINHRHDAATIVSSDS